MTWAWESVATAASGYRRVIRRTINTRSGRCAGASRCARVVDRDNLLGPARPGRRPGLGYHPSGRSVPYRP